MVLQMEQMVIIQLVVVMQQTAKQLLKAIALEITVVQYPLQMQFLETLVVEPTSDFMLKYITPINEKKLFFSNFFIVCFNILRPNKTLWFWFFNPQSVLK